MLSPHNIWFTQELHKIRAHLLYYVGVMEDFHNAVIFLQETSNPVMDTWSEEERQNSKYLLEKECRILLTEIDRLKRNRDMQDKRLKNVMGLVYSFPSLLASILRLHIQAFSSVNAEDSRHMACLTEISLRDSAAKKNKFLTSQWCFSQPLSPLQVHFF